MLHLPTKITAKEHVLGYISLIFSMKMEVNSFVPLTVLQSNTNGNYHMTNIFLPQNNR